MQLHMRGDSRGLLIHVAIGRLGMGQEAGSWRVVFFFHEPFFHDLKQHMQTHHLKTTDASNCISPSHASLQNSTFAMSNSHAIPCLLRSGSSRFCGASEVTISAAVQLGLRMGNHDELVTVDLELKGS